MWSVSLFTPAFLQSDRLRSSVGKYQIIGTTTGLVTQLVDHSWPQLKQAQENDQAAFLLRLTGTGCSRGAGNACHRPCRLATKRSMSCGATIATSRLIMTH